MNLTAALRQVRRAKYVFLILRYTLTGAEKYQTSQSFEAERENESAREDSTHVFLSYTFELSCLQQYSNYRNNHFEWFLLRIQFTNETTVRFDVKYR